MENLLTTSGLWEALKDEKLADTTTAAWDVMQEKACGMIRLCVTDDVLNESDLRSQDTEIDLGKIGVSLSSQNSHEQNLCSATILWFEDAGME